MDEASRHSIPAGLDLAAMGSQCLLCGDPGQSRPYSYVRLLASACEGEVTPKDVVWPLDRTFLYNNVHMQSAAPHVHRHDSQRFAPPAPCNSFCTARAAVLVSWYNNTG